MIEHITLPVSSYDRAKEFYVQVLEPLGYVLEMELADAAGFMEGGHTSFWIAAETEIVPLHVAFRAPSHDAVHAFYERALALGATDNGAPGLRPHYSPDYYAAFVRDLDGHNIEAVCFAHA